MSQPQLELCLKNETLEVVEILIFSPQQILGESNGSAQEIIVHFGDIHETQRQSAIRFAAKSRVTTNLKLTTLREKVWKGQTN